MRVVYLGTPEFAVPPLEALAAAPDIELLGVICQPDRQAGRGLERREPAVKTAAARLGLPLLQPERIKADEAQAWLEQRRPEALAVVAYGQILPRRVFELPRWGAINAHASLLPRYRGAAPIQWALVRGETVTGVTTMRIEAGLDSGPILMQRELAVAPDETAPELSRRLAPLAAELLLETLRALAREAVVPRPQDAAQATLAPLLTKDDGLADWSQPARELYNRWRGFQPWPGLHTSFRGQPLQLIRVRPAASDAAAAPGTLALDGAQLAAACGSGALVLDEVRLAGRAAVAGAAFARGARLRPGERLGG
ncbi:MAG TPA: methionyl-tRNA formyltransferase [Terriglobales bacterium]|nr:methionyl-tRNA formyltransferase [Terriglobales bacterium]